MSVNRCRTARYSHQQQGRKKQIEQTSNVALIRTLGHNTLLALMSMLLDAGEELSGGVHGPMLRLLQRRWLGNAAAAL